MLDLDLGYLWSLAAELHKSGIDVIPASSPEEAETLLAEIRPKLDLLLVDCRHAGACRLARQILDERGPIPIIATTSESEHCGVCTPLFPAGRGQLSNGRQRRIADSAAQVQLLVGAAPVH